MAANRSIETRARIVDAIYRAIRLPQAWPDVVRSLGDWLDADIGMMLSPTLPGANAVPLVVYGLDMAPVLEKFPNHAGRTEFTNRALATGRAPGAFLLDELMPVTEQPTNAFWRDIIEPLGIQSGIFTMVRTPNDNLKPVLINFYRRAGKAPYREADVADMTAMIPHLRRALGVILDAPPASGPFSEMSDVYAPIGAAAFFIGPDGRVLHQNHAGDTLLAARDGLDLCGGRLALWDKDAQRELDAALVRVIGDAWSAKLRMGAELLARRPSGDAPLVLIATPVGAENPISAWAAPVRCVIFAREEELRANAMLTERLQRLYGLTTAEAEIAVGVASGASSGRLAAARGTKAETVRTQIKSAMSKMGARKQTELAALVNRLTF
jgi:DNA-binding CsgD family transcriptional regulator